MARAVVDNAARAAIRAGRGDLPAVGNPWRSTVISACLDLSTPSHAEGVFGRPKRPARFERCSLQVGHVPLERHQGIVARGRRLSQFQAGLVVDQRDEFCPRPPMPSWPRIVNRTVSIGSTKGGELTFPVWASPPRSEER